MLKRIWSAKLTQTAVALFCLLAVSLTVFALAQEKKEDKKLTLREAVTRENENLVRPRAGFELVKTSKTSVTVRAVATKKEVGTLNCTVCPGGSCITRIHPNGSNSCVGCDGKNNCLISPF